eukprot:7116393-Alexandrium_andersonii.AAC.1
MSASLVGSEMCIRDRFYLITQKVCSFNKSAFLLYRSPLRASVTLHWAPPDACRQLNTGACRTTENELKGIGVAVPGRG